MLEVRLGSICRFAARAVSVAMGASTRKLIHLRIRRRMTGQLLRKGPERHIASSL